ncbi:hypothetical protein ACFV2H_51335 [Streptomyces sp. NPDC059629]|uniref:hypothetical protein n=1 Tax=Streptomyces sp. NPDC059629 TaxID=3346889 RepID=UPI0036AAEFCE
MILILPLTFLVLALIVWRGMDKARDTDVTGIVRVAVTAIVTLVLTYVALHVVPPEAVPGLLSGVLNALKTS